MKIIAGKLLFDESTYMAVRVEEIVGKTVEAIGIGSVNGEYGPEPLTALYFTDTTRHCFIHPIDTDLK
jgi:hypothetical protein